MKLFALAAAVLVDLFQPFGHVFDLVEERCRNVEGPLLGGGQSKAIAGTRIDFNDFTAQFILLLRGNGMARPDMSPEEMQQVTGRYRTWMSKVTVERRLALARTVSPVALRLSPSK